MKKQILAVIEQIEKEYDVKILYACESGSRAWGFPSNDSDYDVRFIYIHKQDWYLTIDQRRDVIEIPKQESLSLPINELLDISGWELTKTLRLFRKSNPALLEWLHANIVYYQAYSTMNKLQKLSDDIFSPVTCIYHYLNMAKGNYRGCLQSQEVRIKQYLNVVRPVLAAKWIAKHNTFPPNQFQIILEDVVDSKEIKESMGLLLEVKQKRDVKDLPQSIENINHFLENEIEHLEGFAKNLKIEIQDPTSKLNRLFRETLEEVWG